ncbi:MAG TPA: SDR family oxidoreductase [Thermoanaerobaculia bacterium]|nr:SDR family oxidoreductase [Thermoanaerobaculia bacterium]
MPTLFFTGYPGFLGSELLPRLLRRDPEATAVCIVQPKFAALATERMMASPFASRIRLVEGDITQPNLGLREPVRDVAEVYHLAAVYDLMVPRDVGMRVNVEGTRNVLDFAASSPALRRVHYVSTCYVSGPHPGLFTEEDLEKGQTFNNFYEETKYLAEVEVRRRMRGGLPATVYRPAVVVGDSTTGATQKFDGPYFVIQWLLRQPRIAMLPVAGRPSRYRFNVVPRNFIVDAIEALSGRRESLGKTYQLADPEPLTVDETISAVAAATGRKVLRVPLPKSVAKFSLDHVPGLYRLMRIPSAAVDYFVHPTLYDTTNTRRDLTIPVPHLRDYLPRLIEFVKAHPEIGSEAMA